MLKIENLSSGYGPSDVLYQVSLEIRKSSITTLIGANGAGKTTLLRSIVKSIPRVRGSAILEGEELLHKSTAEIVRLGVSLVPEGRRIFGPLTVLENLKVGAYTVSERDIWQKRIEEVFALFPRLKERESYLGSSLSGGEQQMLAIGRALMAGPKILLLDEPSMGLAPVIVNQVFEVLGTLRDAGITVLLVEQNANRALEIADWGYVLESGRITLSGTGKDLIENSAVIDAYLGTSAEV